MMRRRPTNEAELDAGIRAYFELLETDPEYNRKRLNAIASEHS